MTDLAKPPTRERVPQPRGSEPTRRRLADGFGYIAMVLVILMIGLPIFWIVLTSFKERPDIYVQPATWWPGKFRPQNYDDATTTVPFFTFLRNSLVITSILAVVKFTLGVLSAIPIATGALGVLRGPEGAPGGAPSTASVDSEYRFVNTFWLGAVGSFPTMSIPHFIKGHGETAECNLSAGRWLV